MDIRVGEALEECKTLQEHSIDLILTDPPFVHETEHYATRQEKFKREHFRSFADFAIMSSYFGSLTTEFRRILNPKGRILLFCHSKSYPVFWAAHYPHFDHVRALIWYKGDKYFSLGTNQAFRFSYEMILHAWNKESYYTPGHRQDVLKYKNVPAQKRSHPAEKPLDLLIHLIKSTCPPNGTVLDPFTGSGAIAVAARETHRECIAFDANPAFVALAQRRQQTSLEEWQTE